MVQGHRLTPSGAVAASTRRLAAGLALSVGVHLLAALGVGPRAGIAPAWPQSLQVDIQRADTPGATLARPVSSGPTGDAAASVPLLAAAQPQQALPAAASGDALPQFILPVDRYFSAREVDVRAVQNNEVELVYPQPAYDRRIEGKLTLRIFINEQGGIDRVTVLEATPPGIFEEATLAAARALRFAPALIDGRRVKSRKTIEVVFNPRAGAD